MNPISAQERRAEEILSAQSDQLYARTDRLFAVLFIVQWAAAILAAVLISPQAWSGSMSATHLHLWTAIFLGGLLTSAPVVLALWLPARLETRMVISVAQACFSGLLIHLSGGRIETHFHIFGSLAFLAFYRDWRVLLPATAVVVVDHLFRGIYWSESVYGVLGVSLWRIFEHAGWVVFEDIFLIWSCLSGAKGMRAIATTQAQLESVNQAIEIQVEDRTRELQHRTKELEQSLEKELAMETRLFQAQKLESIGQLAAGIAHEINTPMQFVNDNLHFLKDCSDGLLEVIGAYQECLNEDQPKKTWANRIAMIAEKTEKCHFDRMQKQMPLAIEESLEGVQRVVGIVRAMKQFSHPGTSEKVSTDINEAVRSTVTISNNRWKYAAEVKLDLASDLPDVKALPTELNQVLLNLVVNAGDAIAEKLGEGSEEKGTITIRTYSTESHVVIEVSDTGCGVPNEIRSRIFDPFFTTKDVGKGTGQGLSISYDVVVNKHQGKLELDTAIGEGSTFSIHLPLKVPTAEADESLYTHDEQVVEV